MLINDLIIAEISGKNAAIHAYDKIVWTVRTGYITVLFGGWGLIAKGALDSGADLKKAVDILSMMAVMSIGFSIGAFLIDRNYMQRKFRVITALNSLYTHSVDMGDPTELDATTCGRLKELVRVSGDSDDNSYQSAGYKRACVARNALYSSAVLTVGLGLMVLFTV